MTNRDDHADQVPAPAPARLTPELEARLLAILTQQLDIPADRARIYLERFRLQERLHVLDQADHAGEIDPRMLARALAVLLEQDAALADQARSSAQAPAQAPEAQEGPHKPAEP